MDHFAPRSLDEALAILRDTPARVLAGGTDIYAAAGAGPEGPVLDVTGIAALGGVTATRGTIRIGAATRWCALAGRDLPPGLEALGMAARQIGGIQIQNAGTIGGNLCNASPAADGVPPLLVLDAAVELASAGATRKVPLADFLTGPRRTLRRPDELVTAVLLPRPDAGAKTAFAKLGSRKYLVISIAMVATLIRIEGGLIAAARVAVGAAGPVARRLPALEAELAGQDPGRVEILPRHLAPLAPIDDMRGTAGYRREAVAELIHRAIGEAAHG